MGDISKLRVRLFTDASYRNQDDQIKSTEGRIVLIENPITGKVNVASWKTRKIPRVCRSVKSAETRALEDGIDDAVHTARLVREIYSGAINLKNPEQLPVYTFTDSKSLWENVHNTKQCEENGGPKVKLIDHMRVLWQSIGFVPDEIEEENEEIVVTNKNFIPPHRPKNSTNESIQFTGVSLKNVPKNVPEKAILAFLENKGLPKGCTNLKFQNKKNSINIDIEGIESAVCHTLIENIHEKVNFGVKIYCRGLSNIVTPPKLTEDSSSQKELPQSSISTEKSIPGLPFEDFVKAKKKKGKGKKKVHILDERTPFIKIGNEKCRSEDFIFSDKDYDSDESDESPKRGFFRKSPIDCDNSALSVKSKVAKLNSKQVKDSDSVTPAIKRPGTSPDFQPARSKLKGQGN